MQPVIAVWRRRAVPLIAAGVAMAALLLGSAPAHAASQRPLNSWDCTTQGPDHNGHCYATAYFNPLSGVTYYGAHTDITITDMACTGCNFGNGWHLSNEMWLSPIGGGGIGGTWVEAGIACCNIPTTSQGRLTGEYYFYEGSGSGNLIGVFGAVLPADYGNVTSVYLVYAQNATNVWDMCMTYPSDANTSGWPTGCAGYGLTMSPDDITIGNEVYATSAATISCPTASYVNTEELDDNSQAWSKLDYYTGSGMTLPPGPVPDLGTWYTQPGSTTPYIPGGIWQTSCATS